MIPEKLIGRRGEVGGREVREGRVGVVWEGMVGREGVGWEGRSVELNQVQEVG